MKKLSIIHLGIGNVGKEVERQILEQQKKLRKDCGVVLGYVAKFTSKNSEEEIMLAIEKAALPFVLIDTTGSDKSLPYILYALERKGYAVLANKKPLAGLQKNFDLLHKIGKEKLFYECVVGAGLPVIRPMKDLIETGDEIIEIQGCFSGTLGFLFSQLDGGKLFSESVKEAKQKGFTEPDPRDDLAGIDVMRKALILARLMGRKLEQKDINLVGLCSKNMQLLSIDKFISQVNQMDEFYKNKIEEAKKGKKVLRFVAKINQKECKVGLQEVDYLSDIGSLKGTDNIISIKTKRYFDNPLIIKGPGAGINVTAAGVFADVLSIAKRVKGGM